MPNEASLQDIRKAFDRAVFGAKRRSWIVGLLGLQNQDGTVTIAVPDRPNWVYVALGPRGDQTISIARNDGRVPHRNFLPVKMVRSEFDGALVIEGIYNAGGFADSATSNDLENDYGVFWHTHRIGSGLEYEHQALLFDQGRTFWTAALTVYINPFRYERKDTGALETWEGGTIDLTGYKPATTGHWAWVIVGVNPEDNSAVAITGSSVTYATALTIGDIDDIDFQDYIPCGAIRLRNDATVLDNTTTYFQDAHKWFGETSLTLGYLIDVNTSGVSYNDTLFYGASGWTVGGHKLNIGDAGAFTISSGAIDLSEGPTVGLIDLRGEGSSDDDLTDINNGQIGDLLVLHVSAPGTYGDITLKTSGNLNIPFEHLLDSTEKILMVTYTASGWVAYDARGVRPNVGLAQTNVISSGVLNIDTLDKQHGLIDVRGEGASDDQLVSISGGQVGDIVTLHVEAPGTYGEITVVNSGNINVPDNIPLVDTDDILVLINTLAGWTPILDPRTDDATVDVYSSFDIYVDVKTRLAEQHIHGALPTALATGESLSSGSPIDVTGGLSKLVFVVNAGSDLAGTMTITGTSVDRNTGAETASDTDDITVDAVTTDASTTDANSNVVHDYTGAYISSKWFFGDVQITTADLTLTDVDIYQVSFEQFGDQASAVVNAIDVTAEANNTAAWADIYFYALNVTGDKCNIAAITDMHITAAESEADKYYRLRRGNLATALDGTSDGIWIDCILGPAAQSYWEDINVKIWYTSTFSIDGQLAGGGGGGGGATDFLSLTDTPSSYSGQGEKYVAVNSGETALEFVDSVAGTIDLDLWMPDVAPDSPSLLDDEFNDSSFDTGLWTEFDPGGFITVSEDDAGLLITQIFDPSDDNCGIYQAIPSGDFTIETKVSISGQDTNFYIGGLTLWEDATDPSKKMDMFVMTYYTAAARAMYYRYTNHTTFSAITYTGADVGDLGSPAYLRLQRTGTTYYYSASGDGVAWMLLWTGSLTFTPSHFGLGTNLTTSGLDLNARFHFFRYRDSNVGVHGLLYGKRINALEFTVAASGGDVLQAGQSGGQSIAGGTGASESLILESTAHATKGIIDVAPDDGDTVIIGSDGERTAPAFEKLAMHMGSGAEAWHMAFVRVDAVAGSHKVLVSEDVERAAFFWAAGLTGIGAAGSGESGVADIQAQFAASDSTVDLWTVGGTDTLTLYLEDVTGGSPAGQLSLYRSAGSTFTFEVAGLLMWQEYTL